MVGFIDIKSKETPLRMNPCQAASVPKQRNESRPRYSAGDQIGREIKTEDQSNSSRETAKRRKKLTDSKASTVLM